MKKAGCYIILLYACCSYAYSGAIHSAVKSNDVAAVVSIIEKRGNDVVNSKLATGITPLHLACAMKNKTMAGMLLSIGAKVDAQTDNGFTPLHWAASKDAIEVAKLLVIMGADVNAATKKGVTPLHWAANKNATNTVQYLIVSGADIHKKTDLGLKPVHWAVKADAEGSYSMLLFKQVSEEDAQGKLKSGPSINLEVTDWASVLEQRVPGSTPPIAEAPQAVQGESLIIPLGNKVDLVFEWIDELKAWVGKYEITNEQFKKLDISHRSMFRENMSLEEKTQPAVYVNWKEAKLYTAWLNRNYSAFLPEGYEFKLPSRSEWQKTARCGKKRIYPWGNSSTPEYGNYSDKTAKNKLSDWKGIRSYDDGHAVSCKVTDSGANEWGLYGIGGNVWEWCEDWADDEKKYKYLAGGSWDFDEEPMLRIDYEGFDRPDTEDDTIGFRVWVSKK